MERSYFGRYAIFSPHLWPGGGFVVCDYSWHATASQAALTTGFGVPVCSIGMLVDKDDLINYQLLIIYQLLIRTFTYQPTVDKTIVAINQLLTLEGLLMIVDKVWKLTNTVRVGLDARSSHAQTQSTFPDTVCSHCPPCHGVNTLEN